MTPDEIRSHPLFTKLNPAKQKFVDTLLSNGNNKIGAAHAAWKCKNDESARTLANRALDDEYVCFLVEQYYGRDPEKEAFSREGALDFAAKQARQSKDPKVSLDFLRLIVQMNGWLVKAADNTPVAPPPDDMNEEFIL